MTGPLLPEDPERLGDYWLAGRLGAGGQGVVYEAYDGGGRRVAVKVLHGDAAADPELRERFGREAAAARRVASFCTAPVIAAELDGPRPFIVSEYVEGRSLRRAVQEGQVFAGDGLHRLATAIATALTAIHEAGVIHRDLKPDNVLIGPDGPRVIDFGVARTLEMSLTSTGLVAGTPTYMAPEVFTGLRAGSPADVFAWGGVMLFAATGEDPFRAESLGGVMHRVLSADPDLSVLPESLRPLVGAALVKEPAARPSARDLLMALISGGSRVDMARLLAEGSRAARAVHAEGDREPALGALAEDAYEALGPAERDLVPQIFLRLVGVGPDGELATRRAVEDELPPGSGEVLRVFAYLLSRRDGEVGLARPALLRAWPRLRAWLDEEWDGLPVHAEIRLRARQWAAHGRRPADLLQGSRLDAAVGWAATGRRRLALNALEREFLDASAALTRRRAHRRRLLTTALAVLLVLSLAGGGLAAYQRDQISAQRDRANGREAALRAGSLRTTDPTAAMLLSVAAWRLDGGSEARSSLMSSLYQPEIAVYRPSDGEPRALSRDGRTAVTVSDDGISLHDVRGRRLIRRIPVPGLRSDPLRDVSFSPSGRYLAMLTTAKATVRDLGTGRVRAELVVPGARLGGKIRFTDDESKVAVTEETNGFVWDFVNGRTYGRTYGRAAESGWPADLPVVPRSGRIAAMPDPNGGLYVRRLPGQERDPGLRGACPGRLGTVAFSPDGASLACGGREITLVSAVTGRRVTGAGDEAWVWTESGTYEPADALSVGLRFSADGRYLAGFADRSVKVWRVRDHRQVFTYQAEDDVADLRLDPDGRTLRFLLKEAVVSLDIRPRAEPVRPQREVYTMQLSPGGRWLAIAPEEPGPLRLWDVSRLRPAGSLPGTAGWGDAVFDRTGRTMVISTESRNRVRAWDVAGRKPLWSYQTRLGLVVHGRAFSPDGRIFAATLGQVDGGTESYGSRLLEWDARTGHVIVDVPIDKPADDIAFAADGRTIVRGDGRILDAATGRQRGTAFSPAASFAVSPAGDLIAVGGRTGRIFLWDTRGPSPVPPTLHGTMEPFDTLDFSPRGDLLTSVSGTGTVQLWDVRAGRRLGEAVPLLSGLGLIAAFSADGTRLYVADQDGNLFELPVGGELVARQVCARAGRTLTAEEWARYLPGTPYRDVC
ncbi:WD40 repeat domain-containing serine/threonine protein kinase [Microbispora sp. KK1-11]|uniref:WD40 repeat domain-containing serine/threonine protein kinase n=1 Tax=Microbispora sp. KK1-11 TaxID=2053005 RepID=UPI00163BF598|nr:WD40 repeat domain-containing serine/threonine-protein kinase [Microbispora sp. KK1-11]